MFRKSKKSFINTAQRDHPRFNKNEKRRQQKITLEEKAAYKVELS